MATGPSNLNVRVLLCGVLGVSMLAPLYAGSFCKAFLATVNAVPDYYASSVHMPLKNLALMPKKFYLDLAGADEVMVRFGESLQKTVVILSLSAFGA